MRAVVWEEMPHVTEADVAEDPWLNPDVIIARIGSRTGSTSGVQRLVLPYTGSADSTENGEKQKYESN